MTKKRHEQEIEQLRSDCALELSAAVINMQRTCNENFRAWRVELASNLFYADTGTVMGKAQAALQNAPTL